MKCLSDNISENLRDHLAHDRLLVENVFRYGSPAWAALIREVRALYDEGLIDELDEEDYDLLESDTGELAEFNGMQVMLDTPEVLWDVPNTYEVFVRAEDGSIRRIEVNSVTDASIVTG